MIYLPRPLLWLCLAFTVSNQQLLPFGGYQHDISFPSITGELRASSMNHQQPMRQVSTGFHLKPPPPLPFLQSFPFPNLFSKTGNQWKSETSQRGNFLPPPPIFNLFTPNTVKTRQPESDAQLEAYKNSLKEEAEAIEKENTQNDITTDFANFDTDITSIEPNSKTFVRLNIKGKDYSYTT